MIKSKYFVTLCLSLLLHTSIIRPAQPIIAGVGGVFGVVTLLSLLTPEKETQKPYLPSLPSAPRLANNIQHKFTSSTHPDTACETGRAGCRVAIPLSLKALEKAKNKTLTEFNANFKAFMESLKVQDEALRNNQNSANSVKKLARGNTRQKNKK